MPETVVVRGGTVVTPQGQVRADVVIADGRIVGLEDRARPDADATVHEAGGRLVLPGLIDSHAHLRQPGHEHKEDIAHGTRAAVAGGYTTVIGMPNVDPVTSTVERYQAALAIYAADSYVDYNHHPTGTDLRELQGLADAGAVGFKVYMIGDGGRDYLRQPGLGVSDHGLLYDIAEGIAATGLPMLVHPHDQDLMRAIERRFHDRGERDHRAYARAFSMHGGMVWDTAAAFLLRIQEVTDVRLHLLHMKTRRMIELVRQARARGQRFTTEVNPVSMLLAHDWANIERLGPYTLSTYIGDGEADALWEAFRDGTLDVVGTDHAPHARAEKEVGWTDMWKAAGGLPHLQETLPAYLAEVAAGRLTIERVVEATATTPARVFGIDDRKGAIEVGRDGDVVVVDAGASWTVTEADVLSKCGWSAFTGMTLGARPELTLLRGEAVWQAGQVVGRPGAGQHVRPRRR